MTDFGQSQIKRLLKQLILISKAYYITRPFSPYIGHILMFHRVCNRSNKIRIFENEILEVSPEHLEKIIIYFLERNYQFLSLDQLYQVLLSRQITNKFIAVTFDDGYVDNYTCAYPVLKKYNIPFAIYVTTNFPDRKAILWWYLLEDLIIGKDDITFNIYDKIYEYHCTTLKEKRRAFLAIRQLIMSSSKNEFPENIHNLFSPFQIDPLSKTDELAMSWQQIKELSAEPLATICAHTVNHYALNKLSKSEAKNEILESKKKIEAFTNVNIDHFSYPFGKKTEAGEREFQIVKECAFKTATTTQTGNIYFYHREKMESLPRIGIVETDGLNSIIMAINGCLSQTFKRF